MKFKIVKLNQFSGNKTGVYSVVLNNDEETLLNKFVCENEISFKSESHWLPAAAPNKKNGCVEIVEAL